MPRRKTKRKQNVVEIAGLVGIGLFVVGIIWLAFFTQPQIPGNPNQTTTQLLAPDFTLTDIDGNLFKLSANKGKVVVLEFMRTTCSACVSEAPSLRDLRTKFGSNVAMVSVSVDPTGDTNDVLRGFRDQNMKGWTLIRDTARVYDEYSVTATPTLIIIDKDGYVRFRHVGVTDSSVLMSEISSLV